MRTLVTAALLMALGAGPAQACHRFSHWAYPWPQPKCASRLAQEARLRPSMQLRAEVAPAPKEGRPAPPASIDEDAERAKAIKTLKAMLGDNR